MYLPGACVYFLISIHNIFHHDYKSLGAIVKVINDFMCNLVAIYKAETQYWLMPTF